MARDAGIDVGSPSFQCDGSNDTIAAVVPALPRSLHAVSATQLRGLLRVPPRHRGSCLGLHCFDVGSEHEDLVRPAPRDVTDHYRRAAELLLQTTSVST